MNQITETGSARCRAGQAVAAAGRTSRTQSDILNFVGRSRYGARVDMIVAALGLSRATVVRQLCRMLDAGIVDRVPDIYGTRGYRYRPATGEDRTTRIDEVETALDRVGPGRLTVNRRMIP